ncbi:2-phosphoxylose phosphatase 1 isoform X2 [Eucyclogobius newberryi]|uniref:2-phosphoxylose phosphatase 1 isoform X2 n=1 Tax=Eucyclogobius newberryi TaxID=166745 RepID=UPI003B5B211A
MMQARNRFLLLVVGSAAALAILSLSAQFFNLMPSAAGLDRRRYPAAEGGSVQGKSRKRVFPAPASHSEEPEPVSEALSYCNTPNGSEPAWEGHSPADHRLLSVQVMIRHGDRYPLYSIPKTKRPAIDCSLSANRRPSHPLLTGFMAHMGRGGRGHWDSPLSSVPRLPIHKSCDTGELTQTGVVQHLRNGQLLSEAYKRHALLPADWSPRQVWVETTGKSRTLQSGLAFLYGLLPEFDWTKVSVRHQWSTLFCSGACDCPARNKHLEAEQRRQYRLRVANAELERTYAEMARTLGLPTRQLRASNPIDSLLCHLCHGIPFPCVPPGAGGPGAGGPGAEGPGGCLTLAQFAVIRKQQLEDEVDRRKVGLYRKYAVLAMFPYLNRTAAKMERVARANEMGRQARAGGEEVFSLSSAHDVTMAPLLSALGLEHASFPRFAARVVFELWKSRPTTRLKKKATAEGEKAKDGEAFVRVLYNGEDVTFHTAFCQSHGNQPLCPLSHFLWFVRRDMFSVVNASSYHEACNRRTA